MVTSIVAVKPGCYLACLLTMMVNGQSSDVTKRMNHVEITRCEMLIAKVCC